MKIGVISDTHGNSAALQRSLVALPDMDAWIHLGDLVPDAEALRLLSGVPVYSVRGNCDYAAKDLPTEKILSFGDILVLATHGHRYFPQYDTEGIAVRAESFGCSVALYGHTHVSEVRAAGRLLIVNPGSTSLPREGRKPSVALLTVEKSDYSARIVLI